MTELTIKDVQSIEDLEIFLEILNEERRHPRYSIETIAQVNVILGRFRDRILESEKDLVPFAKVSRQVLDALLEVEELKELRSMNDSSQNELLRELLPGDMERLNKTKSSLTFIRNHFSPPSTTPDHENEEATASESTLKEEEKIKKDKTV